MRKTVLNAAILSSLLFAAQSTNAVADNKYQVTKAEEAACGPDAINLCGDVGEDQDGLLACMKRKRASLSARCRSVLDQGLRRRGLR